MAGGLIGGLALMLAQLSRNQMVVQKVAETGVEVTSLHSRVVSILGDAEACKQTLGGKSIAPAPSISQFKNRKGTTVLTAGTAYNRLVQIDSAKLINITGTGSTRETEVEVTYKKLSRAIKGQDTVVKTVALTLEMDAADKITNCHAPENYALKEQLCNEMGGAWIASGKTCTVPNCTGNKVLSKYSGGNLVCTSPVANQQCGAGKYLKGFNVNGDKLCEPLPAASAAPPDCASGEVLTKTGGVFGCVPDQTGSGGLNSVPAGDSVKNKKCPDGEVLQGFDDQGDMVCVARGPFDPRKWTIVSYFMAECTVHTPGTIVAYNPPTSSLNGGMFKTMNNSCDIFAKSGIIPDSPWVRKIKCRTRYLQPKASLASYIAARGCGNPIVQRIAIATECKCNTI